MKPMLSAPVLLLYMSVPALCLAAPPTLATTGWSEVGSAGFSAGEAGYVSLAIAPDGTPYVAYMDGVNSYKATVKKYSGGAWSTVGIAGFSGGEVSYTSLAIAPDGTPHVAYDMDVANDFKASVMQYGGGAWSTVGSAGFSAGQARFLSLAIAPGGTPYVAYRDVGDVANDFKATVMQYSGGTWSAVGNAKFSAGSASYTSLAIAPDGTPCVAYSDYGNSGKATVMQYSDGAWRAVGNAGFSVGQTDYLSLAIAPDGTPYVAYTDYGNNYKATVMQYRGGAWSVVGNAGFSAGPAYYTSLAIAPDGTPYVAYMDRANNYKATVMKYSGGAWMTAGSTGFSAGQADYLSLAISPDGTPYVAYMDTANDNKATVMVLVSGEPSTTMVSSNANPSTTGQVVTFTATVAIFSGTLNGSVTFKDGATTLCQAVPLDDNAQAMCSLSSLNPGTHTITATYSGDGNHIGSSGTVDQNVVQARLLSLTVSGVGNDMVRVTRNPQGSDPAISCVVGMCLPIFPDTTAIVLTPVPDTYSFFDAWNNECTGSTACSVTMNADKSFTAAFISAPVANITTQTPYTALATALTEAKAGADIRMLDMQQTGPFTLSADLLLSGGWSAAYQARSGLKTLLKGNLTVQSGGSTAETLIIRGKLAIQGGNLRVKGVMVQP